MNRKRMIATGTVLLGIGLSASHLVGGDVAPAALALEQDTAAVQPRLTAPPAPAAEPAAEPVADACAVTLDLIPEAEAMIGVTVLAPCHPGERVVLSHGGLAFTLQATATGSVFTSIPAMAVDGTVTARLGDGTQATASTAMPDAANTPRFAVQWQAEDRFSLNAYAPGAVFGAEGHARAVALADLPAGTQMAGRVIRLGTDTVDLPLMAEVYTFARDDRATVTIEAEVTAATCNRELLGETVSSQAGRSVAQELTLAMPDCSALGQFLVLNIAPADLTLALAE